MMAHVYGHCDFFKNNFWFSKTSRKMMDEMANHGNRVRRYMDEVGVEEVEEFIDACLSLEDQIDIHSPFIRRRDEKSRYDFMASKDKAEPEGPPRFRAKDYMDSFINPRDKLAAAAKELDEKRREPKAVSGAAGARRAAVPAGARAAQQPGRPTCSRSSATRPITSPRRAKPRS